MPDNAHVAILRDGVQAWNGWRDRHPEVQPNLFGFQAPEINLARANLRKANLENADLSGANLSKADLTGADMSGANLTGAYLQETVASTTRFYQANLRNATLQGAKLAGSDLRDASLQNAKLNGAALQNSRLSRADIRNANLAGAHLAGAHLESVTAVDAIFTVANLQNAKCAGAYLVRSVMTRARLIDVDLSRANLSGANLRKADLSRGILTNANLYRVRAVDAKLTHADLRAADLSQADMTEADLSGAAMTGANITDVDLRMANLQSATLDNATLHRSKLWETSRAQWSIRGVLCEVVFWDQDGTEATVYAPGEFARLHSDHSRIELIYERGVTQFEINTLPLLLDRLARKHPDSSFRLRSIEECPGGTKVVIVVEDGDVEKLREEALKLQEFQMRARLNEEHVLRMERLMGNMVTEFFGAIPKIMEAATVKHVNINAPIGAYLDGGTQNSVDIEQNNNDLSAIRGLVSDLMSHRSELVLPPDQSRVVDDLLARLQQQLAQPSGEKSTYRELLTSLRTILEHSVAVVVAHGVAPEWLPSVIHKIDAIIHAF
jgi:uncharacterized protein YjbI with pentapeptide repeats